MGPKFPNIQRAVFGIVIVVWGIYTYLTFDQLGL